MKPSKDDWLLLETLWDYLLVESELPTHADAIIVGGSGEQTDGADRAAQLYHDGRAQTIIVSGFNNPYLTRNPVPEAMLLRDRMVSLGVPDKMIIVDKKAENTGENILHAVKILAEKQSKVKDIILIHKPYMTRRFLATAEAQWPFPQPNLYVTSQPSSIRKYYRSYESSGGENKMIELMLGDYERIKQYPSIGRSTTQPRSDKAESAYRELIRRGFAGKKMG